MAFDAVQANAGSGGESFAFDQFTDSDALLKTMAYTAIAYGPLNGPYSVVTTYDPLPVSDTPTSPHSSQSSEVAVTPGGASAEFNSTAISVGKTGKLARIEVASSVPFKVTIQKVLDGVATTVLVKFGYGEVVWSPPHKDYLQVPYSAGAGFDGFRVLVQNLDAARIADLYAYFAWDEVDS